MIALLSAPFVHRSLSYRKEGFIERSSRLDELIQRTPDDDLQRGIASKMWEFKLEDVPRCYSPVNLEAYFRYYTHQADFFLHDAGRHVVVRTHDHILRLAEMLRQDFDLVEAQDITRTQIFPGEGIDQYEALNASMHLAIRLLLMIEIGTTPNGFSHTDPKHWKSGKISQVLSDQFAPPASISDRVRLERMFTARNLERIAGMRIKWTSNLADHLWVVDAENEDRLVVHIFHHASFLVLQKKK